MLLIPWDNTPSTSICPTVSRSHTLPPPPPPPPLQQSRRVLGWTRTVRFQKAAILYWPLYRLRYQRTHPSLPSFVAQLRCTSHVFAALFEDGPSRWRIRVRTRPPPQRARARVCCASNHADHTGTDPFPYPPASCPPPLPRASGGQSQAPWCSRSSPCAPSSARFSSVELTATIRFSSTPSTP